MDGSSMEYDNDRMVKIEFEAAEALAGLAHVSDNHSVNFHQLKDDSNNSSFHTNSYEDATNLMAKKSQTTTGAKLVKDEQSTELGLNPSYRTNCGRKSRQNLTEAEMEARKIRRVLANRESARQTIRRRQAVFEELTRKAVDLAWENENLKRDKDSASKHLHSLKTKNECLKAQMVRINNIDAEETKEESVTTNEPTISASSTNSPFIIYNQSAFLPFVWPQLQCGLFPISTADSSSCEEGSSLYILPYPWVVTVPQNQNQNQNNNEQRPHSFNLNDKPKEFLECNPPLSDGGEESKLKVSSVSCDIDDTNTFLRTGDEEKIHKVPVVWSGKRLGDMAAATEARKRRKQLTRLKNHFHCRQLRMH